ncbi:unnamed protein product (macronuclear) [Paramecium tetraurelia]|uniref:Uncharacterized protein n=1 Tax=Paramecium tetraurelia TaxID=5888 RepID=A0D649_PARTE|nr:uncharacterized protein GSPATT00013946001 [Paramecium tetraurelia]CAK78516.1 unnamed protein product [Paramecium tetraurelia]|eukprot:XP_001445913.1 hypothetical protein (macronuclear) [Paramecium tetraurelia strain d4-2]
MNPTFKQSQQIENSSNIMGSSAGFNRKIKLASQRPGSRDQKLKTGEMQFENVYLNRFPQFQDPLATNPFNLQSLNLYQDENTFITTMKAELHQIQEGINKLDFDGRIRNNDPRQEYRLQQVKKWVAQNSQSKLALEKLNNIEISQLLTILDVQTLEEAIVKLYKFISIMDSVIMKVTEYEAIHLIKFDELFSSLCPNYQENLQQISVLKFPIAISNINRMTELYQVKQDKNQQQKLINDNSNNQGLLKQIKQKDDQISELNKTIKQLQLQLQASMKGNNNNNNTNNNNNSNNNNNNKNENSQEQIDQIRNEYEIALQKQSETLNLKHEKEIEMFQTQIEQFQKQLTQLKNHYEKQISDLVSQSQQDQLNIKSQYEDKLKQQQQQQQSQQQQQQQQSSQIQTQTNTQQQSNGNAKDHNYYQKILDNAQLEKCNLIFTIQDLIKLRNQLTEKQTIIESLQREVQQWKETIDRLNKVKDEIYQQFQKRYTTQEQFSNSYEAALKLEFETMKKSFEQKIQKYQQDLESQRREAGRSLNEIRVQLEREQETKKLLLNKLSLYI